MLGQQHQRGDDLQAVNGERERVLVPPGLSMLPGELAHVAVADRPGKTGQGDHGADGRPANRLVREADLIRRRDADGLAAGSSTQ
jgi:hypothetical protein